MEDQNSENTITIDLKPSTSGESPYVKRRLFSEEVKIQWNIARLIRPLGEDEQALEFAVTRGLLLNSKLCRAHRIPLKIFVRGNPIDEFRCTKSSCAVNAVGLSKLEYLYQEVEDFTSREWLFQRYNYCREKIVIQFLETFEAKGKIDGPGKIVQIDESKFKRRKLKKGIRGDGHWFSVELRMKVCPENVRSAAVLVPLINKHVNPGTIIHTDCWKAHDCLGAHGFIHKKVNHTDPDNHFVGPDGIHTQRIESQWRVVKYNFIMTITLINSLIG